MARFFKGTNINLGENNPKSALRTGLTNYKLIIAISVCVSFSYLLAIQSSPVEVTVLQIWTIAATFQLITRGVNGIVHLGKMNELLEWYRSLYTPVENPVYQGVMNEHLRKQNYYIQLIMK